MIQKIAKRISNDAPTAVSIAFPFKLLIIVLATGLRVGINIVVSSYLGKRDYPNAGRAAKYSLILDCMNYAVLGIPGFLPTDNFVGSQTDIAAIVNRGTTYMKIISEASSGRTAR